MPTVLIQGSDDAYLSKLAISGKTMEQLHFAKQKTMESGLKNIKMPLKYSYSVELNLTRGFEIQAVRLYIYQQLFCTILKIFSHCVVYYCIAQQKE